MASEQEQLAQFAALTGASLNQAQFYLDANNKDLNAAVASYFDNPAGGSTAGNDDNDDPSTAAGASAGQSTPSNRPTQSSGAVGGGRGAYTLSGAPVEPMPAGWGAATGSGSNSGRNSGASTPNRNPIRSSGGPRVTGFRDLAAASAGPSSGGGGFGGFGGGGDDSDDEDGRKDPQNFYTGGAKSGLSVENPDDPRRRGGISDMLKNILQQAREGSSRLAGGEEPAAGPSFFTGSAHTLGSDETPSTYIPDPTRGPSASGPAGGAAGEDDEEEEEEEVAVRNLTFWEDGFSIEDGDLMKYDENKELLEAIQSGRAPISVLRVKHDQPVELRIAERRHERWTRQPPPPQGPFAGSGNRLGAGSPFPESRTGAGANASAGSMPGSLPPAVIGSSSAASSGAGGNSAASTNVEFEVDRNEPTTQVQIRLRTGDRMVATFNHTHTVGDIRRYIERSRPGETQQSYVLQTTFPTRELTDLNETIKQAGLLGSVVVQRPT
ncbi:hypothetical protein BMF94_1501 [Rhodotorula taiwanensis]|uniref:UBX domain-containing protein n=1 Tax=Rhodotorula taiwanensis TaxID=741276 RepID=A0A2S5BF94_9BASI|nr:hypothetical protein BMF94_1501 [Rhodotorula taiwanensis]